MTDHQKSENERTYNAWLGDNIRRLRKQSGLTQKELAVLVGKSMSSLCYYERGQRSISTYRATRFAEAFGITLDELLKP